MFTFPVGHFSSSGFEVDNSMVLDASSSQFLIKENPSNSTTGGLDARKKFTVSLWWKHGTIPSTGQNLFIQRNSGSNFVKCSIAGSGGNEGALQFFSGTLGVFSTGDSTTEVTDNTVWSHITFYYDSTDSVAGDRARIYLNGTRLTSFQTAATNPSSGAITQFGSNNAMVIGQGQSGSGYSDGKMAELVVIDGQALEPSSFTEGTGSSIKPLNIENQNFTFGDQGFYLPFTVAAGLGTDYSGSTAETKVQENTYAAGSEVNKTDMTNAGFTAGVKFTAVASAALPTVKIRASSTGFSSVTVRIETDGGSGNAPSGTLVDSNSEVTGITSSGAGLKTADFPNGGPVLTAGTLYWIVLANAGNWGWQHDVSGSGGALGIRDATGYQAGRGLGHEVYQLGNIFTPTNSPTQSGDTPTSTPIVATGGTITTDGDFKVHTFTASGTFAITSGRGDVDFLVIAGGGGGESGNGGGGGAGGYRNSYASETSGGGGSSENALIRGVGSYTVTVGAGGTNANGSDSVFDTITSLGGGRGGDSASPQDGHDGGSGGGAGNYNTSNSGGSGTANQGFDGGDSSNSGAPFPAAGGGGAGAVGGNSSGSTMGAGGAGLASSITGSSVTRAGGGGGGASPGASGGAGGSGGGGAGGSGASGTNGTANTGGGGGGSNGTPGNGGSGVVIIRYQFQ